MRGRFEFMILGFEGVGVSDAILGELDRVQRRGTIRIIDLLLVAKDGVGAVTAHEMPEFTDDSFPSAGPADPGPSPVHWFSDDDISDVAARLHPLTSAIVLLAEHVWASRLHTATLDAGGYVVAAGPLPSELVDEVEAVLSTQGPPTSRGVGASRSRVGRRDGPGLIATAMSDQRSHEHAKEATLGPMERLRQLGELRASGVLTDEEFEREKARVLANP